MKKKFGSAMQTVIVNPVSISKSVHNELSEALPVYDTVRRWLEVQPNVIREGAMPVKVLKELLEQCAMLVEGNVPQRDAINEIHRIIS